MPHNNLLIAVSLAHFQKFDHGEEVEQKEFGLVVKEGDRFRWDCAQYCGLALVVSYDGNMLRFKKLS